MVIWPVSSLRVANKAQQELYAAIRRDGGTQAHGGPDADARRTLRNDRTARLRSARASIVKTIVPEGMPQA